MARYRFERFDLDTRVGELRRDGVAIKLQPQPLKVLSHLVEQAGRLVTREALQAAIWGDGTFVDFQRGLNFCVTQIRGALRDSAATPRFIETVPRRGYRFIAPVEVVADATEASNASSAVVFSHAVDSPNPRGVPGASAQAPASRARGLASGRVGLAALLVMTALTAGLIAFVLQPSPRAAARSHAVSMSSQASANEAYLNGQYLARKGSRQELTRALEQFQLAASRDPRFAAADAAAAETAVRLVLSGRAAPRDLLPAARLAATRAIAIDAGLAEAHAALGAIRLWYDWNAAAATRDFERALRLDPSLAVARHDYGWALIARRRFDEGLREIREAQRLDPLSPRATIDVGWALIRTGRYADAIAQSRRALALEPEFAEAQGCLELALRLNGQLGDAVAVARASLHGAEALPPLDTDPARAFSQIAAFRLARLTTVRPADAHPVSAYQVAAQLAALGRTHEALGWLEQAFAERSPMMALLPLDPAFGPALGNLHAERRFVALVRRVASSS